MKFDRTAYMREYMRTYRKKNKDQVKQSEKNFWEKKMTDDQQSYEDAKRQYMKEYMREYRQKKKQAVKTGS